MHADSSTMKLICLVIIVVVLGFSPTATSSEQHRLGSEKVTLRFQRAGKPSILFLNVHENEQTSVSAARRFLASGQSFLLLTLHQNGQRNLRFREKGQWLLVDPNRMFTKQGRLRSLALLNKTYPASAEESVEEFSDKVIRHVKAAKLVVALHNNTNGKPLRVTDYQRRYVNPGMDTDDFVLTTDEGIFLQLKARKLNAVWETTASSLDDGSLAYFCSKENIPYINVEAQHGHGAEQLRMLRTIDNIIAKYR